MKAVHSSPSGLAYIRSLAGAALEGIETARQERNGRVFTPPLNTALWRPTVIGAALGALTGRMLRKQRSASRVAVDSLVGTLVGCGAGMAWASRGFLVPATSRAARRVSAARDAHWLETNPIDYA